MQYKLRSTDITIEPILAFDQSFLAVAMAGETKVIRAEEAFALLFQPANGNGHHKNGKHQAKRGRPRKLAAAAAAETPRPGSTNAGILKALSFAPQTTSEVFHFVTERLKTPVTKPAIYSAIHLLSKRGVIEKREEKESHLDKWFLKNAA